MPADKPNIAPFGRAIERLKEGIVRYYQDIEDEQIRDGLIKRFEFTYQLSHSTLKRYLEFASPNPGELDKMTFQDMIRTANEQGLLLGDWSSWRNFREMRTRSSHTYDEGTALQVIPHIPEFIDEVVHLYAKLQERLG